MSRSARLARRMARVMTGTATPAKPLGVPRLRKVMRVLSATASQEARDEWPDLLTAPALPAARLGHFGPNTPPEGTGLPCPVMVDPVSENIVRTVAGVGAADRRVLLGHGAATVWLTGLSGSGKSTIAGAVEAELVGRDVVATVLDGDDVRFGLNADLGFSPEDRTENIRRVGHVARLMVDAGVVVLASFISPYRRDRDAVRAVHDGVTFIEVFVDTPLEVCEARDVKGLYARARTGEIADFSGISAPFEAPTAPDLRLDTSALDLDGCVAAVVGALQQAGVLD